MAQRCAMTDVLRIVECMWDVAAALPTYHIQYDSNKEWTHIDTTSIETERPVA